MSRSPTYCRVLIPPTRAGGRSSAPPPEPRGAGRLPAPGTETTALAAETEPRPAGTRTHPILPPASSPPPDTAGTRLVYTGPTAAAGGGGGQEPHPGEPGHRRLLRSGFPPRRAGDEPQHRAQGPSGSSPLERRARRRPTVMPILFSTPTWARGPHSPG